MKSILITICFFLYTCCSAQVQDDLVKAFNYYQDILTRINKLQEQPGSAEDLAQITSNVKLALPYITRVYQSGSASGNEKRLAYFLYIYCDYYSGYAHTISGYNHAAYSLLKPLEEGMIYLSDSKLYPIMSGWQRKMSIDYDHVKNELSRYYKNLSELCIKIAKYDEAILYSKKLKSLPDLSVFNKFVVAHNLVRAKVFQKQEDVELVGFYIDYIHCYMALDSQTLAMNPNLATPSQIITTIKSMLKSNPELQKKGKAYEALAWVLARHSSTRKEGLELYRLSFDAGNQDYGELRSMYLNFGEVGDIKYLDLVIARVDSVLTYSNEIFKPGKLIDSGDDLLKLGYPEKAVPFYIKAMEQGYSHTQGMAKMLTLATQTKNAPLQKLLLDHVKSNIATGDPGIDDLASMMDIVTSIDDREIKKTLVDKLEKKLSKMKLAEQCQHASIMMERYSGWGCPLQAQKWLDVVRKCSRKSL